MYKTFCTKEKKNRKKEYLEIFTYLFVKQISLDKNPRMKNEIIFKESGRFLSQNKAKDANWCTTQTWVSPMCQQYLCVKWLTLDALTAPLTVKKRKEKEEKHTQKKKRKTALKHRFCVSSWKTDQGVQKSEVASLSSLTPFSYNELQM